MANKRFIYLTEGECETKLIDALKVQPALVASDKIKKINVITEELTISQLMMFAPGSTVVLVFDTDVEKTDILKKNIDLLKKHCERIEVLTVAEVLNFEDEIVRATDIKEAIEITKSKSIRDYKAAVNKMKAVEFRRALSRHKLDMSKLWEKTPPKAFDFIIQDGSKIKL